MLRYFDARTSNVSAKKEIKFLSVLCSWAKSRGWMRSANPVEGTTRQMKVDESRDVTILCDEKGQKLLLQGKFRSRFYNAREAAKNHIDTLTEEHGAAKLHELGLAWFPFQFRDLRPKAATDKERATGMAETRRFLGHTTERQTADYVRAKIGELVNPVSASQPGWMAKVLSPKTQSKA